LENILPISFRTIFPNENALTSKSTRILQIYILSLAEKVSKLDAHFNEFFILIGAGRPMTLGYFRNR